MTETAEPNGPSASPESVSPEPNERHAIQRVRHELVRRQPEVVRTTRLSPGFVRVTLGGPELAGFVSAGFDDHVKCFFPDIDSPEGEPVARDFTPRHFDAERLTLDLDFALHGQGPADAWARTAKPGDRLRLGGPRGSMVIPMDFDGYWLIGDASAWPAMARRLRELPAGVPVQLVVDVHEPADIQPIESDAAVAATWLHGDAAGSGARLSAAVASIARPAGDVFAWAAGETLAMREVRAAILARGLPKAWVKVAGYWRRGATGVHDTIGD